MPNPTSTRPEARILSDADRCLDEGQILHTSAARRLIAQLVKLGNKPWINVEIREYPFGAKIYQENKWYSATVPVKESPPGTTYLGIVLTRSLEASVVEVLPRAGTTNFSSANESPPTESFAEREYHRPAAVLRVGSLFGTYEAMDLLCRTAPLKGFTLYSGVRTFFFEDKYLDRYTEFKGRQDFHDTLKSFRDSRPDLRIDPFSKADFQRWYDPDYADNITPTSAPLLLLSSLLGQAGCANWKAKVLLFELGSEFFAQTSPEARRIRELIVQTAWEQSANLRRQAISSMSGDKIMGQLRLGTKRAATATSPPPAKYQAQIAREISALVALLREDRPGFHCLNAAPKSADSKAETDEFGPYADFFDVLEKGAEKDEKLKPELQKARPLLGSVSRKVYVSSYLFDAPTRFVYPLWPNFNPDAREEDKKGAAESAQNKGPGIVRTLEENRWKPILKTLLDGDNAFYAHAFRTVTPDQDAIADTNWAEVPCMLRGYVRVTENAWPELPLLSSVPLSQCKPFDALICAQHLMDETLALLATIERRGLVAKNRVWVIGKPYSSNQRILHRLGMLGFKGKIPSGEWLAGSFDDWFQGQVSSFLDDALSTIRKPAGPKPRVGLLDDGGALVAAAGQFAKQFDFVAVEQTSRGLLKAFQAKFPVVTVACSALKSRIEPEFVARAAISKVAQYYPEALSRKNIGIVGLGSLGLDFARFLAHRVGLQHEAIRCFDSEFARRDEAAKIHKVSVQPTAEDVFRHSDVIYGCTGNDIGSAALKAGRRGQLLVSLSSGDVEFATVLRQKAVKQNSETRPSIWAPVYCDELTVAHGGLPITFDGSASSAPLIEMQLTRALLLGALQQAAQLDSRGKGAVPLDDQVQREIAASWLRMMHPKDGHNPGDSGAPWSDSRSREFPGDTGFTTRPSPILTHPETLAEENRKLFEAAKSRASRK